MLQFTPHKGIWIPESVQCLLLKSKFLKIVLVEYGILGFGIQNTAQGIRNPTNDWNPEFKFH